MEFRSKKVAMHFYCNSIPSSSYHVCVDLKCIYKGMYIISPAAIKSFLT